MTGLPAALGDTRRQPLPVIRPAADLLVFCGFVLLTIALTYPIAWHLSDSLPGYPPEDNFHYLWELWYPSHAIFEQHTSPFVDTSIYSPFGFDLIRHQDLSPATVFLFAPFTYALGEVVSYNLIVLTSFALTAFGTYLFCRELWGSRLAAIVAGTAIGFCTYRVTHALGHLSLVNTQWIPFFLLYLERSIRNPTRRNGALAGLFFSLSALVTWYYAVGCAISALLYLSVRLSFRERQTRELVRPAAAAALVTIVLVGPFAISYVGAVVSGEITGRSMVEQATYSASISDFVIPPVSHPVWGRVIAERWRNHSNSQWLAEWQIYLGFVPLALAAIGVCAPRTRTVWALIAVGGGTLLLALGPTLQLTHSAVQHPPNDWGSGIPLPVRILALVPPFSLLRAWSRMAFFVELVVAILAARGVFQLLSWMPRVFAGPALVWRCGVVAGLLALTVVDTLAVPYPRSSVQPRRVDQWLAVQSGDYAIVDFPVVGHGWSGPAMYRRRVTGKRTVLGYGRHPPNQDFWPTLSTFPASPSLDLLQWWGVKYVLVDEARYRFGSDFWGVRHTWTTLQPEIAASRRLAERVSLDNVHVYELLPPQDRTSGPELLANPGFEDSDEGTPSAWAVVGPRVGAVLNGFAHTGKQSVAVTSDGYFVSSKVPVSPGRCYEVAHVNRGDRIHDSARLQVNWLDESGRDLGAAAAVVRIFNVSPTWRRARAWARAPLASESARVYAVAHRGQVWLDDFSFHEVEGECADLPEQSRRALLPPGNTPTLTATPNPVSLAQGIGRTTVTWSTGKEPPGPVYVSENGGPEVLFAGLSRYGSQEAGWIGQGKAYEFRLYSGANRQRRLASVVVTSKREPTLSATPNAVPRDSAGGQTEIRWSTGDGSVGEVFVSIDDGPEILFARNPDGAQHATWLRPGSVYVFRLYRADHARKLLASLEVRPSPPSRGGHGS